MLEQKEREREIWNKFRNEIKFSSHALNDDQGKQTNRLIFVEFDKNVITPGTEFMFRLSKAL